jgi:predicted nucleotidyltransferase
MSSMIEIIEHGGYLEVDAAGFVVPISNKSVEQENWKPLVRDVVEFYRSQLGEKLVSVFVRGSLAKGTAVEGISDVDSFFVAREDFEIPKSEVEKFEVELRQRYPFCTGVELFGAGMNNLTELLPPKRRSIWHELIKTQSVCVWGASLADGIAPFALSDMVAHSYWIGENVRTLSGRLDEYADKPDDLKAFCTWICKRLIRVGFEIVMLREQRWTRDLYPCYKSFSKYYPERESLMLQALQLALNPTDRRDEIVVFANRFLPWLEDETRIWLKAD